MLKINNNSVNNILVIIIVVLFLYIIYRNCKNSKTNHDNFSNYNNKIFIQTSNNRCNKTYSNMNSLTHINNLNHNEINKIIKKSSNNNPLCYNETDNQYCEISQNKTINENKIALETKYIETIKQEFPELDKMKSDWKFNELYLKSFENVLEPEQQKQKEEIDNEYKELFKNNSVGKLNNTDVNNKTNSSVGKLNNTDVNNKTNSGVGKLNNTDGNNKTNSGVGKLNNTDGNNKTNSGVSKQKLIKYNSLKRAINKFF